MLKKNNATHKTFEQRAHCKYFFIVLFKGKNCLPTGVLYWRRQIVSALVLSFLFAVLARGS